MAATHIYLKTMLKNTISFYAFIFFLLFGLGQLSQAQSPPTFRISNPEVLNAAAGTFVELQVHLDNIANRGVTSVNFRLTYDPNVMFISKELSDQSGSIMPNGTLTLSDINAGEYLVVIANPESSPITSNGLLLKIGAYLLAPGNPNVSLLPRTESQNPPLVPATTQAAVFPSTPYTGTVSGQPSISLSLGSVSGSTGASVDIPVTISDIIDRGIRGFLLEVKYDPNLIQFNPDANLTIIRSNTTDVIGSTSRTNVGITVDNSTGLLRITGASTSYYTNNYGGRFFTIRGTLKGTGGNGPITMPYVAGKSYLNAGLAYQSTGGTVTVQQVPGNLNVSPTSASVPASGGTNTITITNTGEGPLNWTASSNQSWATVSPASGSGNGSVTVTSTANTGFQARSATITITAPGAIGSPATVTITQAGNNFPAPTISSVNPSSGTTGSTLSVTVTGSGYVQGSTSFSFGSGITVNSTTVNSATSATVSVSIAGGASAGTRNVTVTNPTPGGGTATLTNGFTVTVPEVPTLSVSPSNISLPNTAGSSTINVTNSGTGTLNWTASSNQSWASLSSTSGTAPSSVTVNVSANSSTNPRSATITFTASGASGSPATVTITQAGQTNPQPTITTVNPATGSAGSTLSVTVTGSGFISGVTSIGFGQGINVNSLSISSGTSLNAEISIIGSATAGPRDVIVTNAAPGGGSSTLIEGFTVTTPTTISITPITTSVTSSQTTIDYSVSFNNGTGAWSVQSNQTWVSLSTSSGNGNGSFSATVQANSSAQARSAVLTLSSSAAENSPVTVTINQAGATIPPPTAVADSYDGLVNTTLTVSAPGVLSNDIIPQGVSGVVAQLVSSAASEFGSLNLNANGGFVFTPLANKPGIASYQYRAVNPQNNTSTTSTITLRIFPSAPNTGDPTNTTPTELGGTTPLEWNAVSGASSYILEYQNQPFTAFSNTTSNTISNRITGLTQPRYTLPTSLPKEELFYYRVKAVVGTLESAFSAVRTFKVINRPDAPGLLSPQNNARDVLPRPTFVWKASRGARSYTLEILDTSNFGSPVVRYTSLADTNFTVPVSLSGGPTFYWRVLAVNGAGQSDPSPIYYFTRAAGTSIDQPGLEIPEDFQILPNYPNPFNPTTNIRFQLPESALVSLNVYDLSGRLMLQIPPANYSAGTHSLVLDASSLGSGLYVYRIQAGSYSGMGKFTLVK